jgi:hypothetical protein
MLYSLVFLSIISCKNSNPVSASYVDTYNPSLTVQKGTTYSGNYFPLIPNYEWSYSGNTSLQETVTGIDAGQAINENTDTVITTLAIESVLPETTLTISSVQYRLYPMVEYSGLPGSISDMLGNEYQYYQIDSSNRVFLRGYSMLVNGPINEVKNPKYIKNPLVAGDSWECQPWMDIAALENEMGGIGTTMNSFSSQCKMLVIGQEITTLPVTTQTTVRLDEVIDAAFSLTVSMEDSTQPAGSNYANLSEHITGTNILNLALDTGIVRQRFNLTVTVSATGKDNGQPVSENIVMDMSGDLKLSSFNNSQNMTTNLFKVKQPLQARPSSFNLKCRSIIIESARKIINSSLR